MMKREHMMAAAAGAAVLAVASPAMGLAASVIADQDAQQAPAPDAEAVAALVTRINQQIAALPADASPADVEAAVLFAIDQAQAPEAVVAAAIAQVKATNKSAAVQTAVANVQKLRDRLANQSGTGGVGGSGPSSDLNFGPSLGASGGGSSDYTPAPTT